MSHSFFRSVRASFLALPLLASLVLGSGCSSSGSGQGGGQSTSGNGGAGGFVCSSGTAGSSGNVCIKWPQQQGGTSTTAGAGGGGGAGGAGGGVAACPSKADATPLVSAMEPYFAIITGEGVPGTNGTCCYEILHELCH